MIVYQKKLPGTGHFFGVEVRKDPQGQLIRVQFQGQTMQSLVRAGARRKEVYVEIVALVDRMRVKAAPKLSFDAATELMACANEAIDKAYQYYRVKGN